MADNEDATATLGDSEVSSVKHTPSCGSVRSDADAAVAPTILRDDGFPAGEVAEDELKSGSCSQSGSVVGVGVSVCREKSGDVLENQPVGSKALSEAYELSVEATSCSLSQTSTAAGHADVCAGESSGEDVDPSIRDN